MSKLYTWAINPWVILAALAGGATLGLTEPALALQLAFVGDIYVDLLKMVVLPFMVSAVIFSLHKLLRHGGAAALLRRTCGVFGLTLMLVAAIGVVSALLVASLSHPSAAQIAEYGRIVGQDATANDTAVVLNGSTQTAAVSMIDMVRTSLVPTNVFAALAQGEALKALVFALLFGLAVGQVSNGLADGLARGLEAVYHACQQLTRWLNYPLPLVLVCMSAAQLAKTGAGPLLAMTHFIGVFALASLLVGLVAVVVLWRRSGQPLATTLDSLRAPFALAVATRSSATCMPAMIDALAETLRFSRERVELLVPLSVSLLRIGPVLYYVCATLFIAHLYGRPLAASDLLVVAAASLLAGCASAGMTGLVTVSLTGMVCSYLGLPFEAAFILFLAVDPVCDMLRTVVLVIGNAAAVSLVCAAPEPAAANSAAAAPVSLASAVAAARWPGTSVATPAGSMATPTARTRLEEPA